MAQAQEVFLFTPLSVSQCSLWLDAADSRTIQLTSNAVSQWSDKSSSGLLLTQGTAAARPIPGSVGTLSNTVLFTTAQTLSSSANLTLGVVQSWFIVFNSISSSNFFFLEQSSNTNNSNGTFFSGVNFDLFAMRRTAANYIYDTIGRGTSPFSANTSYVASFVYDNTSSPGLFRINGTTRTTAYVSAFTALSGNTSDILYINTRAPANVHTAEIIVYNKALGLSEMQQVEGYLAWKWGLQGNLPSTHPFKTYRPLGADPFTTLVPPMPFSGLTNPVFLPTQIGGCQLWLDAADPFNNGVTPANGATISAWVDKSGNGRTMTATTSGTGTITYSTYKGIGSILFNSTNANPAYMRVNSAVNLTSVTVFAISRSQTAIGNQNGLLAIPQAGAGIAEYNSTDAFGQFIDANVTAQDRFYGFNSANPVTNTNPAAGGDAFPLRLNSWVVTSTGTTNSYYNGTTGASVTLTGTRTGTATGFGIGFDIAGSPQVITNTITVSQFSEFIVYNTALNDSQRQQVEGYLAWKWGLQSSLPSTQPYSRNPIAPFPVRFTPFRGSFTQWLPNSISSLLIWFDATDSSTLTLSGTQVTRWNNKGTLTSVFASNVSVGGTVGAYSPGIVNTGSTFLGGTLNVLSFPPISTDPPRGPYLGVADFVTTQKSRCLAYIFSVSNPGVDNYTRIFTTANTETSTRQRGFIAWNRDGDGIVNWPFGFEGTEQLTISGQAPFSGTLINSTPYIAVYRHSTVANNNYFSVDGNQIANPVANQTLVNGYFVGTDNFIIGTGPFYTATLLLGEVMQFDGDLTTTQLRQLEGYLAWKWGRVAQLPLTHPFKFFPPPPP